jgi:hypothetical protein
MLRYIIINLWTIVLLFLHLRIMSFKDIFAGIIRWIPTQLVV